MIDEDGNPTHQMSETDYARQQIVRQFKALDLNPNRPDGALIATSYIILGLMARAAYVGFGATKLYDIMPPNLSVYPTILDNGAAWPTIRVWENRITARVLWEVDFITGVPVVRRNFNW